MSDDCRPSCSRQILEKRVWLLSRIRGFMTDRSILEVETPIIDISGNIDPNINSLETELSFPGGRQKSTKYLHTSPEFVMKKLLASDSRAIYQITKVFRDGEIDQLH